MWDERVGGVFNWKERTRQRVMGIYEREIRGGDEV